jgi:Ca2+-binding RTX toxin-like protein
MANIVGNNQVNNITGTQQDDSIQARGGGDTVRGRGGNDTIDAGSGGDTARGGPGNDTIAAGAGGDTLDGGTGDNTLIGGLGADTFVVDIGRAGSDTNVIPDFQDGLDVIELLSNGSPLGTADVNALVTLAAQTAPTDALNDTDAGAAVAGFDGFQNNDAVQVDFALVPNLNADVGDDFLTVVGVSALGLGTDLILT